MLVCVECGHDVNSLYKETTSGSFRLSRCRSCGCVADGYIEQEIFTVFLDLVLLRVPAFRHILFNRGYGKHTKELVQFGVVIALLDVYDRFYSLHHEGGMLGRILQPIRSGACHDNYLRLVLSCVVEDAVFVFTFCTLSRCWLSFKNIWDAKKYSFRTLLRVIFISSYTRLCVLLWLVWRVESYQRLSVEAYSIMSMVMAVWLYLSALRMYEVLGFILLAHCARALVGYTLC